MRKLMVLTTALIFTVLGLANTSAAASTRNESYTIHGTAQAVPTVIGTCEGAEIGQAVPIEVLVTGTATISRLGRTEVSIVESGLGICVGAPVPAPIAVFTASGTYTAANGDELDFQSTSTTPIASVPGTPWFRFSSTDALLPTGTGRFAKATGSLLVVVTFDPTANPTAAWFTINGTITIPKS